jgi:BMFP domain-containing protein YqiC
MPSVRRSRTSCVLAFVADLDFVPRDEFNAVKAMASKARAENDKLAARVATLEAQLTTLKTAEKLRPKTPRPRKAAAKKKPVGKL